MPETPYIVSTPPHIKANEDVTDIMKYVCIALIPAFAVAFYNFGVYAMAVTAVCVISCIIAEALCQKIRGVDVTVSDYSAIVTGLLLAAVIPPNVELWVAAVGGVFAIAIAKHCFGGLGNNIWNPALLSRAFLQVAVASQMNSGVWGRLKIGTDGFTNFGYKLSQSFKELGEIAAEKSADVVSQATAMAKIAIPNADSSDFTIPAMKGYMALVWESFLGIEGGCIAEVSALGLLIGGLLLLKWKIITWEIPVMYLGSVALLGWALPAPYMLEGAKIYTAWFSGPMLMHLVGGGVMIGAFFMATDMVTSPMSRKGRIVFGLGCGILTVVIRVYSSAYPEGVCYSILLMNTCVPLIDAWTKPRVFGRAK